MKNTTASSTLASPISQTHHQRIGWLLVFVLSFLLSAWSVRAAAPANDNFVNRQTIGVGTVSVDTTNATVELSEPYPSASHTVWYTYTTTSDVIVTLDNTGTTYNANFMAVYMGTSINNLATVTSAQGNPPYKITFKAKAGTTFQICGGSYFSDHYGTLQFTLTTTPLTYTGTLFGPATPTSPAPANDNFASRTVLTGNALTVIGYNTDAGVEIGEEPYPNAAHTLWYSWTATSDTIVTINYTGTDYNANFMAVYMGTSINNLATVTSYQGNPPYQITFKAKAGTTFQICGGSYFSDHYGTLQFTLTTTPLTYTGTLFGPATPTSPAPANDNFASRTVLTGNALTVIGYNTDAGTESGEPYPSASHTVWYTYTTTSDVIVTLDNTGTDYTANFMAVYIGSSINNLAAVTSAQGNPPYKITFKAKAGTTFQICGGSYFSDHYGTLQFTLTTTPFTYTGTLFGPAIPTSPAPANDDFASRSIITGNALTVIGYNDSATVEPGEPTGLSYDSSLWYSWTPSTNATVTIDNTGTSFAYSDINVYTGSSIFGLTLVAGYHAGSSIIPFNFSFNAVAGTEYKIYAASTNSNAYGTIQFALTAQVTTPPTRIIALSGNMAFGKVKVGTTKSSNLTISNTGNSTMTVTSITYPIGYSGNWSGTIAAGSSHVVAVTFAPTAKKTYKGTLTVNCDKTSGTNTDAVSGKGK